MPSEAYQRLKDFIDNTMSLSHVYQPVMLRTLVEAGGYAATEHIAQAIVALDESQVRYYTKRVSLMPGKVLASHGMVEREGKGYRLTVDVAQLSPSESAELVGALNTAVSRYLESREYKVWEHRDPDTRYFSTGKRYRKMVDSAGRCELCGATGEDGPLHADHIVPLSVGGKDAEENLQVLCGKCNQGKGAGDDTRARELISMANHREVGCLFCEIPPERIVEENPFAYAIRDGFPVTPAHTLVIPRRHVATYFELFPYELNAIHRLLNSQREGIMARDKAVEGFNIGMNNGEAAGQTVFHCHVHLIPRRKGDVDNPRGGVRHLIPGKGHY